MMGIFCFFPYGAIGVTVLYGLFCYAVLAFGPDCPAAECRTEGVDNSPIAWSSNFFIAIAFGMLGVHILFMKRGLCRGFLVFLAASISHILWGMIGHTFGNDGTLDGVGNRGYFVLNMLAYIFAAESLLEVTGLAVRLWTTLLPEYQSICCGRTSLRVFEYLVFMTILVIAWGCIWCSATGDVWVTSTLDEFPNDIDNLDIHTCIRMVDIGQVVFTAAAALFWVSVASIYGASARQQINELDKWYFVWGMPTSLAAAAVICFQTTLFVFHLMAYMLQNSSESTPDNAIATGAAIAYHYSILMTGFFAHNFLSEMSIPKNAHVHQINKRTRNGTSERGDGGSGSGGGNGEGEGHHTSDESVAHDEDDLLSNIVIVPSFCSDSGNVVLPNPSPTTLEPRRYATDPPAVVVPPSPSDSAALRQPHEPQHHKVPMEPASAAEQEHQTKMVASSPGIAMPNSSLMDDISLSSASSAGKAENGMEPRLRNVSDLDNAIAAFSSEQHQQLQPQPQPAQPPAPVFCGLPMDMFRGTNMNQSTSGSSAASSSSASKKSVRVDPFQAMEQGLVASQTTGKSPSVCNTTSSARTTASDMANSTSSPGGVLSWLSSVLSSDDKSDTTPPPPPSSIDMTTKQRNDQPMKRYHQGLEAPSATLSRGNNAATASFIVETREEASPPQTRPRKQERRGSITKYSLEYPALQIPSLADEAKTNGREEVGTNSVASAPTGSSSRVENKDQLDEEKQKDSIHESPSQDDTEPARNGVSQQPISIFSGIGSAMRSVLEDAAARVQHHQQTQANASGNDSGEDLEGGGGMVSDDSVAGDSSITTSNSRLARNSNQTIRSDDCVVTTKKTPRPSRPLTRSRSFSHELNQEHRGGTETGDVPPVSLIIPSSRLYHVGEPARGKQHQTLANTKNATGTRVRTIGRRTPPRKRNHPVAMAAQELIWNRNTKTSNRSSRTANRFTTKTQSKARSSLVSGPKTVSRDDDDTSSGDSHLRKTSVSNPTKRTNSACGKQTVGLKTPSAGRSSLVSGPKTVSRDDDTSGSNNTLPKTISMPPRPRMHATPQPGTNPTISTIPTKNNKRSHQGAGRRSALVSGPKTIHGDGDDTTSASGGDARDDAIVAGRRKRQDFRMTIGESG